MADENKNLENEEVNEENENIEDQNEESGGKSGSEGSKSGSEDDKGGKKTGADGKVFTQEQVNKMMTREKNQGRNAVYKELGIDPKDSKAVAMVKAILDSQKTEEQKIAEKQTEEQTAKAEAEHRALVAEAKAEAMMMGVKTQYVEDAVTLALAKMTEDSDLKTIIGELKTKYPIWFGESDEDDDKGADKKGKAGQKGTGSSVKTAEKGGSKKGEENKGLGARLAAQRKAGTKKSSYWGNK